MKRPEFIKHYSELKKEDNLTYKGSNELLSVGAPVGRLLGLTKIGIHIETLAPGRRTSWPHAESHEEEFAFVVQGTPQAWVDGHVFDLTPGDFVAFPSGTGISHTFLNNTEEEVVLLVGGEANKEDNKIFYPMHPHRNEQVKDSGHFWEGHPKKEFGDHDGMPDKLRDNPVD